jgi:hypothetical protein
MKLIYFVSVIKIKSWNKATTLSITKYQFCLNIVITKNTGQMKTRMRAQIELKERFISVKNGR